MVTSYSRSNRYILNVIKLFDKPFHLRCRSFVFEFPISCFGEHENGLLAKCFSVSPVCIFTVTFVLIHSRPDLKVREANHRDNFSDPKILLCACVNIGFINLVITTLIFAVICLVRIIVNAPCVMEKRG